MATLYYTSDTHSYLYPDDHQGNSNIPMGYGLLSASFKDADLIMDGGDVLQGSPLIRYEVVKGKRPFTAARAFNIGGLGLYVPGNHDFNYGPELLKEFMDELDADIVCANLVDHRYGMRNQRYVVKEFKDGVKVLFSGVVSDYVNVWEKKENLEGIEVTDCVEEARKVLEESKNMDVDFRILIYHGGFDDTRMGDLKENRGDELCELGYDMVLTAHQHVIIQPKVLGKSITLQTGTKCQRAAKIVLEKGRKPEVELISASLDEEMKPEMKALLYGPVKSELDRYLDTVIGHIDGILEDRSKLHSALNGSSLADFINDIQRNAVDAELSACSLFNVPVSLEGDVTMGDLLSAYPFANTLVKFRIKAEDLKKAMERAAEYFVIEDDGNIRVSDSFVGTKLQHYNYDYWRGVDYTFDITRPVGDRVVRLECQGDDLLVDSEREFIMVVNSYRATGTGGYDAYRNAVVLDKPQLDIQDVIIDEFEKRKIIEVPKKTDFKVIH